MKKCNRASKICMIKALREGYECILEFGVPCTIQKVAASQRVSIYLKIKRLLTSYLLYRPMFMACVKANLLLKGLRLRSLGGGL